MQSIQQLNPTETVRSAVFDPEDEINRGRIAFQIIDLAGLGELANNMPPETRPVASAVSLEPRGNAPGLLSCTLRVREPRRRAARTDRPLFSGIDAGRKTSEEWPHRLVSVNVAKRIDGAFKQSVKLARNAIDPELEMDNFATAANDHNADLNRYVIDRLTRLAGDAASPEPALTACGWQSLDWDASYTVLGSSTSFATHFHAAIATYRLGAFGMSPNALYCSQTDMEKLQRDPSLRGMLVTGDPAQGVAAVNITTETLSAKHVRRVFAEHFGLTIKVESSVADSAAKSAASGTYAYQWPSGRMWLGREGPVDVINLASAEPSVSSVGGAFALFHNGLGDTGITEEGEGRATHRVYAIESFPDFVPLIPEFGMIIYDMNG